VEISVLPVSTTRVSDIWKDHFFDILRIGHLFSILAREYNKLKSPQSVRWQSETTAHSWSLWIANEAEAHGEE
jgi:hypothetical protein